MTRTDATARHAAPAAQTRTAARRYPAGIVAEARTGRYAGRAEEGVICFRGIRYALPPNGHRRWKAPVPVGASDEVFEAYDYGFASLQKWSYDECASWYPQSEDCLTLNVFSSELRPAEPKPVMVWIHGGSGIWGGTIDPLYHGERFVRRRSDVILVTINYRLGLLGRLDLSRFGEEFENGGNQGLLDQIEALRWVRENISAFGGDPANVTIFGESEGGASVAQLLVSPLAEGLFHKAILQSGAQGYRFTRDPGCEESRQLTERLLELSGATSAEDLAALTEAELVSLTNLQTEWNHVSRDGRAVPEQPWEALRQGRASSGVPLMIGATLDEDRYFGIVGEGVVPGTGWEQFASDKVSAWEQGRLHSWGELTRELTASERAFVEEYLSLHPERPLAERLSAFVTDAVELAAMLRIAELHARHAPTFVYSWNIPSAIDHLGACHAVELAYTMFNLDECALIGEPASEELAAAAHDAWVNFAIAGDPSTEHAAWHPWETGRRATMVFTEEGPEMQFDPRSAERELVQREFVEDGDQPW